MFLGIDTGTTSISGVLYAGETRAVHATTAMPHDADVPNLPAFRHEQSPESVLAVTQEVIRSLTGRSDGPVRGIGLTGQMHGLVAVDQDLRPLTNLITWRDRRTADLPEELCRHAYARETGCFLHPGYGGLTLHHLLQSGDLPEATFKVLSVPGYIAAKWTGRCVTDETLAASWGLWNVRENRWHEPLLRSLGIPAEVLPEFVPAGTPIGTTPDGITVYSPLGDNQAGVLGALQGAAGGAVANIGTSSQLSVPLRSFAFHPRFETRPMPGGGFIQTHATLCGGWALAYLAGFFQQAMAEIAGAEPALSDVYAAMERMAGSEGSGGLRVDTRFDGERTVDAVRHGSVTGMTTENFTPGNLVRAFAEGIAGELAGALETMEAGAVSSLILIGNAARKNRILREAMTSAFGLPCRMAPIREEGAFGAVLAALTHLTTEKRHV